VEPITILQHLRGALHMMHTPWYVIRIAGIIVCLNIPRLPHVKYIHLYFSNFTKI